MGIIVQTQHNITFKPHAWWYNFINYVYDHAHTHVDGWSGYREDFIAAELKKFNARYIEYQGLEFDSEQDYVMFILRWS